MRLIRMSMSVLGVAFALACSSDDGEGGPSGDGDAVGAGGSTTPGAGGSTTFSGGGTAAGGDLVGSGGGVVSSGGGTSTGGSGPSAGGSSPAAGGTTMGSGGGLPRGGDCALGNGETYPVPAAAPDEDGSDLWLRYPEVPIPNLKADYAAAFVNVVAVSESDTLAAAESELVMGLSGLTGQSVAAADAAADGSIVIGKVGTPEIDDFGISDQVTPLGPEGFAVERVPAGDGMVTVVAANSDVGVLYGSFALLRLLQMHTPVDCIELSDAPKVETRMLNHWDDLDGGVERGYAGRSIWDWSALPGTVSQRYTDYARALASLGINGTVVTNVNATKNENESMWVQRDQYFPKVQALADVFRPYGIKIYLTAPFNAGGNANPNDSNTRQWWAARMDELYDLIPDFGGLLIKASSEGEPGPSNGASHADGANMLAEAIGDRGIVLWRAFVYGENLASDRIRQAHDEFKPLDGDFADNVFVQAKNGPLDFQPREPIHPLFGDMPGTNMALELQITKEYLGQDTHLSYLGPMWEEILKTDTHANGTAGNTVARVVDGTVYGNEHTAIAGVSNVGNDTNWTGSHFNQANWYAFGRMAWNPDLSARQAAEEWIRLTLSNDADFVQPVADLMMSSYQTLVDYMTPLGLVHIMGTDHHYGPMPWENSLGRAEWNPYYYHEANGTHIGFDRTASGSGAISQYQAPLEQLYGDLSTVPNDFLLFFHRVEWTHTLDTGRSVWDELVHRYSLGVDGMQTIRDSWAAVAPDRIDQARLNSMSDFLEIQHYEARWWRDACLSYFMTEGNGLTIPEGYAAPANDFSFYEGLANTCPPNRDKPRCMQVYNGDPSPAILP